MVQQCWNRPDHSVYIPVSLIVSYQAHTWSLRTLSDIDAIYHRLPSKLMFDRLSELIIHQFIVSMDWMSSKSRYIFELFAHKHSLILTQVYLLVAQYEDIKRSSFLKFRSFAWLYLIQFLYLSSTTPSQVGKIIITLYSMNGRYFG